MYFQGDAELVPAGIVGCSAIRKVHVCCPTPLIRQGSSLVTQEIPTAGGAVFSKSGPIGAEKISDGCHLMER